jgi:choline dehydrogenase-like flavoprotein
MDHSVHLKDVLKMICGNEVSRILLRATIRGRHPRAFPEYFSEPEDLRALARSVRRMREMMCGQSIRDLIEAALTPGPIANEQAAIEDATRFGSCLL